MNERPTIHVVTEFKRDSKLESYWYECFHDEDFHDYDVHIIDGTFVSHEAYLYCDTFFKSVQLKFLLDMVHRRTIKDGDIIVFANAWNYAVIPLSYFRDEFRWNIHLVGFWGDSLFNQNSPMWGRFKGVITKTFARQIELILFNAYDMNCFWSEPQWKMFQSKFSGLRGSIKNKWNGQVTSRYAITGYPFGYLAKEAKVSKIKTNTIVFPYNLRNDVSKHLIQGLRTDLPKYEFVFAQDQTNDRLRYNQVLQDGKIMISTNRFEVEPVLLYEGMLNGLIPMVPDHFFYPDVFPEIYLYPHRLSHPLNGKMMYLHRSRKQLERIITDHIDNYENRAPGLAKSAKKIGDKYYSNKPFIDVLNELHGRPAKIADKRKKRKLVKKQTQY